MTKLSEEVMSKAKTDQKLSLVPNSQVVNAKEKFLKELKSTTPANTRIRNSLTGEMEKVLVVWMEEQTSHSTPLCQSLTEQGPNLTLFNSMKDERGEEAEEKYEASRDWFMRFKGRSPLHDIKS